ncbi:hypothetical protein [Natronobiforma cellulositropha]|uniref:hypothetical protein n=1 Tax=Natronobiforma cellulositropha TaxID=1679076 RepID=UPI0021D5F254|nr:hypothetical protein [Natronobiforma cellulositropha]
MAGYYDVVLGLIPVALLGITAALTVVGVSLTTAVPIGAAVAIGLIGHAMFVNAPTDAVEESPNQPSRKRPRQGQRPPINAE